MAARDPRSGRFQGIALRDPRWSYVNLRAKGGAGDSDYTQAGPRAGIPEAGQKSSLVLRASGSQGADGDLEVRTQKAGSIGLDDAAFVWRNVKAGDTTSQYKGYDGPALVTGWESLLWTTAATGADFRPHAIRLQSGKLLCVYGTSTLGVVLIKRYDPATSAWSSVNLTPDGAGVGRIVKHACLMQLPLGRVVCYINAPGDQQIDAYASSDDGATWAAYGLRVLDAPLQVTGLTPAITYLRAAYNSDEVLLVAGWSSGATVSAAQYASSSLGVSFKTIDKHWDSTATEIPVSMDIIPLRVAGFLLAYVDTRPALSSAYVRRIGSAFSSFSTGAASAVESDVQDDMTAWRDEYNVMHIFLTDTQDGAVGQPFRSSDDGMSWSQYTDVEDALALHSGATLTNRFTSYSAVDIGGRTAFVSRFTAGGSTYDPGSVVVAWMGGFSSHTAPNSDVDSADGFREQDYIAWGDQRTSGNPGGLYLPITTPDQVDWTHAGAGSTTLVASAEAEVNTPAGAAENWQRTETDDSMEAAFYEFAVDIDAGDGSTAANQIVLRSRFTDGGGGGGTGTFEYDFEVRLADTGYRVHDNIAAADVGGVQTFDLTTRGHIRIAVDIDGNIRTWHARAGQVREWTPGTTGTLTDAGAALGNPFLILWGHVALVDNISRWAMVGYCCWPGSWSPLQNVGQLLAEEWDNPDSLHPRPYPSTPQLMYDSVDLWAVDGPTSYGETWRIKTRYEYGVENLHPEVSPSPRVGWRSLADNVVQRFVWDIEDNLFSDTFMGNHAMLLLVLGANWRTGKLMGWNVGGAAWDTIATIDAADGFTGLRWTRRGSTVRPDNAQTSTGTRYLWREQHAGDTIDLNAGEAKFHRIQHNTEGAWRTDATGTAKVKQPTLWLESTNLTAGMAGSGNGNIWCRDFGVLLREYAGVYQRFALEIDAQKTADGYYAIGEVFVGDLLIFGQQYDRGWVWTREWNAELVERQDGARRVRRMGPARRTVDFAWVETAVRAQQEQTDSPSPDYLSSGQGDLPVASRGDVLRAMEGLLERTHGPSEPLVYVSRIPQRPDGASDALMLTDRRRFLYGRVQTQPKTENLAARTGEAVDEVERLNTITVEEEV